MSFHLKLYLKKKKFLFNVPFERKKSFLLMLRLKHIIKVNNKLNKS